jgi:long-subunit fatty acid transport protein
MKARLLALLLALPALSFSQYKPWYNFYNFAYGAKARAMGNAFTAVADDLTAAYWNPAGLAAKRGPEFYLSYMASSQAHDYDLQDKAVTGETRLYNYNLSGRLNQIDYFSVSAPTLMLKRPFSFALSYYRYIPYGFKGSVQEIVTFLHDRSHPRRTTVTFTGSEGLDVLAFSAAAAATQYFSLGVTLQQFFGSGSMNLFTQPSLGEDSYRQYTEKLQGRSVIVGALFAPAEFLRLGITWHSGLRNRLDSSLLTWKVDGNEGESEAEEISCQARVTIPEQYSFGFLLRPARWLDLSGDYSRIAWEKGTIENYYDSASALPYPQLDDWPGSQQSARNLRFGLEARVPFRSWNLNLRGGWSSDRQLYADITGRAVRVLGYSAGIGCEFRSHFLVEAAFQKRVADWPEDGFAADSPDVATHFRSDVLFLALTYRFGHVFKE